MRRQVIENLSQVAPPGEQFLACVHCETGPSPWLNMIFERIPFLVLIIQMMRKYYFITLTSGHVVFNRASMFSNRPKEVVIAIPVQAAQFSGIKKGQWWSRMYFQFPGESKPTRMNFHRIWNPDIERFIAQFPHAVDGVQNGQQGPQQAVQQGQYQAQPALAAQQGQYQGQQPPQGQHHQGQYAPQQGQYQGQQHPQQQYPPQGQQYPPQGQQYPQQQYPPQGQQYPPQGQSPYQR
jgi:hypothetical protein